MKLVVLFELLFGDGIFSYFHILYAYTFGRGKGARQEGVWRGVWLFGHCRDYSQPKMIPKDGLARTSSLVDIFAQIRDVVFFCSEKSNL